MNPPDSNVSTSRGPLLNILFYLFSFEKVFQHLLTAIFFVVEIPGIGTPSIGEFQISNNVMAFLNIVYTLLFFIGIIEKSKRGKLALRLIIGLSLLDIVLEFVFHGLFFITVSVIVSSILTIVSILYLRFNIETEPIGLSPRLTEELSMI